jgi:hypothetical protein
MPRYVVGAVKRFAVDLFREIKCNNLTGYLDLNELLAFHSRKNLA